MYALFCALHSRDELSTSKFCHCLPSIHFGKSHSLWSLYMVCEIRLLDKYSETFSSFVFRRLLWPLPAKLHHQNKKMRVRIVGTSHAKIPLDSLLEKIVIVFSDVLLSELFQLAPPRIAKGTAMCPSNYTKPQTIQCTFSCFPLFRFGMRFLPVSSMRPLTAVESFRSAHHCCCFIFLRTWNK